MSNPGINTHFGADFHEAFRGIGLADLATVIVGATTYTDVRVFVDRELQREQREGVQLVKGSVAVDVYREQVPVLPEKGSRITVDGETFTVEQRLATDETWWRVLCRA